MPNKPRTHKQKKTIKQHDPRPNANARGYDRHWQKVRAEYIAEHPLCEDCLDQGKTTPVYDVDHIIPLSQGGERLDKENMRSLCRKCHNIKTRRQV